MRAHLVSVVAEIDELRHMLGFVRFMGGEYGDDGIGSNAIERVWIAGDDAFKSVFLEDGLLERLLVLGLACHGGLRHDDCGSRTFCERVKQMLHEAQLVL